MAILLYIVTGCYWNYFHKLGTTSHREYIEVKVKDKQGTFGFWKETAQKHGPWEKKVIKLYLIGHWARQRSEIIVMRVIQTSTDFAGDTNPAKFNQIPNINACQHKYFQHWHNSHENRKP